MEDDCEVGDKRRNRIEPYVSLDDKEGLPCIAYLHMNPNWSPIHRDVHLHTQTRRHTQNKRDMWDIEDTMISYEIKDSSSSCGVLSSFLNPPIQD